MYDLRQHLELFHGPGHYLFRGTLPSGSFAAPYEGPGVTPASVDPVVATLFACRYRMDGPAIVLVAQRSDFAELLDGPNLESFRNEPAVNIELPPADFEMRCILRVAVDESLAFLDRLGYRLPPRLPDLGALTQAMAHPPRMEMRDIERYVELCRQSPG